MKLYNTITRKVENFEPLAPPSVSIYTCGPTVYDYPHVGNWFTFIRYELLIRVLRSQHLQPNWIMNITDVGHLVSDADEGEDKLEKGARREGKTAWEIAQFYTDNFIEGMELLNFVQPNYMPKATDHIAEQVELIKKLESKGFTYVIDDGVYYDTSKFPRYASFALLDVDEQIAGKRVEFNKQKINSTDFALWKFSPKDSKRDMEWESPWGIGYPGWHLECSAMCMKYLGETIDIHAGGIDHLPVHHTNEIAQSEAVTGKPLAKFWMHTNHVSVNGERIGKSLGNAITLEEVAAQGFTMMDFRLHVLESHYRTQSKFSWDSLESSQNRLKNYGMVADMRWQPRSNVDSTEITNEISKASRLIEDALSDDLNTPKALAVISGIFSQIESKGLSQDNVRPFNDLLVVIESSLGINLLRPDISSAQKDLLKAREQSRANKDWQKSDKERNILAQQGIGVLDSEAGPVWFHL